MKLRYLVVFISISFVSSVFAQKQVKEFFNEEWKHCDSTIASYYRLITYDDNGHPVGTVRDFYMSGELQWEGKFTFLDKYDSYNNKHEGLCTWYYENGKRQSSTFYEDGQRNGTSQGWYENGTKSYDCTYKNGVLHGLYVSWFESGMLQAFSYYDNGKIVGNDVINCDEFGECGTTVKYNFFTPKAKKKKNGGDYDLYELFGDYDSFGGYGYYSGKGDPADFTSNNPKKGPLKISFKGKGLIMTASKQGGIKKLFYPLDYKDLMVITTKITHVKGDSKSGLVFAYQDEENYHSFLIDKNGNYEVGAYSKGEYSELAKGTATASTGYDYDIYDFGNSKPKKKKDDVYYELYMVSYKDTMQCFVGYTPVYKTAGFSSTGDYLGYKVGDKSTVKIKELSITKAVDAPFVSADIDAKTIKHKAWKSTGSGFVVSRSGYIVTNNHVVDDANEIEIDVVKDGHVVSYNCEVVLKDEKSDLAVIRIDDDTFTGFGEIPYTLQTKLEEVGTNVYALGYPFAMSTLGNELKYTEGSINARTGKDGNILAYQVSAPVQPGNSGGPLLDYDGNVIGVINSKLFYADNVAFAIKANYILNLLYLLPEFPDYPEESALKGKTAAEQVNILREFIPLIKVR